jgi:hypothetical protein
MKIPLPLQQWASKNTTDQQKVPSSMRKGKSCSIAIQYHFQGQVFSDAMGQGPLETP